MIKLTKPLAIALGLVLISVLSLSLAYAYKTSLNPVIKPKLIKSLNQGLKTPYSSFINPKGVLLGIILVSAAIIGFFVYKNAIIASPAKAPVLPVPPITPKTKDEDPRGLFFSLISQYLWWIVGIGFFVVLVGSGSINIGAQYLINEAPAITRKYFNYRFESILDRFPINRIEALIEDLSKFNKDIQNIKVTSSEGQDAEFLNDRKEIQHLGENIIITNCALAHGLELTKLMYSEITKRYEEFKSDPQDLQKFKKDSLDLLDSFNQLIYYPRNHNTDKRYLKHCLDSCIEDDLMVSQTTINTKLRPVLKTLFDFDKKYFDQDQPPQMLEVWIKFYHQIAEQFKTWIRFREQVHIQLVQ